MAKRPSRQPVAPKQAANLMPEDMRLGITKIERRISELKNLDIQQIDAGDDPKILALQASIEGTLESVFGSTSDYDRYNAASQLDLLTSRQVRRQIC